MRNLCDAAKMSCEGATLPFQAHANSVTWSIEFDFEFLVRFKNLFAIFIVLCNFANRIDFQLLRVF